MPERWYIAIDLKSFFASVECVLRGLDPLGTNLVVADVARTEKTICLAVSPSLKAYGIPGRARLFEVIERLKAVNEERLYRVPGRRFTGESYDDNELKNHPDMKVSYIAARPQMARYIEYSKRIYSIYLKYVAPEDILVYSIDEVFMDVTSYLNTYGIGVRELAMRMIRDVFDTTGITATAGIGTNMYLCKVAMDIVAKHMPPDENGVRIAGLDEMSYRKLLWNHKPITDFWRVGRGYASKLASKGIYTMGDVARCSVGRDSDYYNEDLLYKLFGVNAELLIDHAWGWEPCTIADAKAYTPSANSLSVGQVLKEPYTFEKARIVIKEMADGLVLDLVDKGLVTDQMVITVGYDVENVTGSYAGDTVIDRYGRRIPRHAHGTVNLDTRTSSTRIITEAVTGLYDKITNRDLFIRRLNVVACHVVPESEAHNDVRQGQLEFFTENNELDVKQDDDGHDIEKEKRMQHAILDIKKRYGKNALLRGMNFEEGATAIERNGQIGGHKA